MLLAFPALRCRARAGAEQSRAEHSTAGRRTATSCAAGAGLLPSGARARATTGGGDIPADHLVACHATEQFFAQPAPVYMRA
jgi:hypothetical protein